MTDFASLSFDIDSSQAQRAVSVLEALKATSVSVTQAAGNQINATTALSTAYSQQRDALTRLADQTRAYDGTLQGLLMRLNATRTQINDSRDAFASYTATLAAATAQATQFNATIEGLDRYVSKARDLRIQTADLATGLERVTAALKNQTVEGHQARVALDQLGVSVAGVSANRPDVIMQRIADQLRSYRLTAGTVSAAQQILGPSFDAQALISLQNQPFTPYRQQQSLDIQRQTQSGIDSARAWAQQSQSQTDRADAERRDLSSRYSQDPTLAGRLGLNFMSGTGRLFNQTNDQQLAELRRISALPADQRRAYTGIGSQIGDFFTTGYAGRTWNQLTSGSYSANESAINAQFGRDVNSRGWLPAIGTGISNEFRNIPGISAFGVTPYQAPRGDARPLSPAELLAQRRAAGSVLAGYGDTSLQGAVGMQEQLNEFSAPDVRQNYQRGFGDQEGIRRYLNQRATIQQGLRYANAPEQQTADAMNREAVIMALPAEQRASARAAMGFLEQQGGGAAIGGMLPGATSLAALRGAPQLNGAQQQVGAAADAQRIANAMKEASEETERQGRFQAQLTTELEKGRAAAEDYTRAWSAWTQARMQGASHDDADLQAIQAVTLAQQQRITQGTALVVQMEQENQRTEGRVTRNRQLLTSDPVTRQAAMMAQGVTQAQAAAIASGQLPDPAGGSWTDPETGVSRTVSAPGAAALLARDLGARRAQLATGGVEQAQGVTGGLGGSVEDNRQIVMLMQTQGVTLERAQQILRTNQGYYEAIAKAAQDGTGEAAKAVELERQRGQALQRSADIEAEIARNRQAGIQGEQEATRTRALTGLTPGQRPFTSSAYSIIQGMVNTAGGTSAGPAPGGSAGAAATLWYNRPEAAPYQGMINEAAAQYSLPPAVLAELIGQESGFKPGARNGDGSSAGGLGQQIDHNVYLRGGDKFDPRSSIFAAAAEYSTRLRQTGGMTGALEGYGTTAGVNPARRAQVVNSMTQAYGASGAAVPSGSQVSPAVVSRLAQALQSGRAPDPADLAAANLTQQSFDAAAENQRGTAAATTAGQQGQVSEAAAATQRSIAGNQSMLGALSGGLDGYIEKQREATAAVQAANEAREVGNGLLDQGARAQQLVTEATSRDAVEQQRQVLAQQASTNVSDAVTARGPFASSADLRRTAANAQLQNQFAADPSLQPGGANEAVGRQMIAANDATQNAADAADRMNQLREASSQAGSAIENAFMSVAMHTSTTSNAVHDLGTSLEQIAIKTLAVQPFEKLMSGVLTSLFGGDGSPGGAGGGSGGGAGGGGGGSPGEGINPIQAAQNMLMRMTGGGGSSGNTGQGSGATQGAPGSSGGGIFGNLFNHAGGLTGSLVDAIGGKGFYEGGGLIGSMFGNSGSTNIGDMGGEFGSTTGIGTSIGSGATSFPLDVHDEGMLSDPMATSFADTSSDMAAFPAVDMASAKGNVFTGNALRDYSNQIITSPTYFRFAKGAMIGQMGEAGAEAVMPLRRGADGSLGVAAHGQGGHTVVFNVRTPDADSFRRSQPQLHTRALSMLNHSGMRNTTRM